MIILSYVHNNFFTIPLCIIKIYIHQNNLANTYVPGKASIDVVPSKDLVLCMYASNYKADNMCRYGSHTIVYHFAASVPSLNVHLQDIKTSNGGRSL